MIPNYSITWIFFLDWRAAGAQFVHDCELLHGIFLDWRAAGAQFVHDSELLHGIFPRLERL
jgi:hypothetical protein